LAGVVIVVVYKPQAVIMSQIDIETGGTTNGHGQCDYNLSYIWKVPDHFRLNHEHFVPRTWRFGLHNRSIDQAKVADDIKMCLVRGLQLSADQWLEFCAAVVPDPQKVQLMYVMCDPAVQLLEAEEIRKLLTLDALFLVAYLLHVGCKQPGQTLSTPTFCRVLKTPFFAGYETTVWSDVCLVENQIPLELLSNVISWLRDMTEGDCNNIPPWSNEFWRRTIFRLATKYFVNRNVEGNDALWRRTIFRLATKYFVNRNVEGNDALWRRTIFRLATKYFVNRNVEGYEALWDKQFEQSEETFLKIDELSQSRGMGTYEHILDIVSYNVNGQSYHDYSENTTEVFKRIPSATTLRKSGVTFKSNRSSSLDNISFKSGCFKSGCLQIPYNYLYDGTEQRFRNLVLHEVLKNGKQSTIRSYTFLMGDLIRTEEDERILVDTGVIGHGLDHSNAHKMWKEIYRNVEPPRITEALSDTLDSIHDFAGKRRNTYWVEYKERHCSRPWFCCSALAVTFVTICTAVQTYIAITNSNHMKPTFRSP
jgi:hypothetical protein